MSTPALPSLNPDRMQTVAESIPVPTYDRDALVPRIIHIGVGGFHRAHLALYVHELAGRGGDWGIHGVGLLAGDQHMNDVMQAQRCLYTLTERAGDDRVTQVIGSIVGYTWCPPEADIAPVVDLFAAETTSIISMTVTEGGYSDDERNLRTFDLIAAGLDKRRQLDAGPLTVMSCDNVVSNGDAARRCTLAAARRVSNELAAWVESECRFPNSMVDRITPATTPGDVDYIASTYGVSDGWPVVCEPFRQWVLEDDFAVGRPEFGDVGVLYSTDVHAWELYKLRMLNAGHSTMAYLSALAGIELVDEAMATPQIGTFLDAFEYGEAVPAVPEIPGHPREAYVDTLLQRFANPGVRDQIARLCIDGTAKFPTFLIPTVQAQLAANRPVAASALALAGWCQYLATVPVEQQANDPHGETSRRHAHAAVANPSAFLKLDLVFPAEVASDPRFVDAFTGAHRAITAHGPLGAIEAVLSGS